MGYVLPVFKRTGAERINVRPGLPPTVVLFYWNAKIIQKRNDIAAFIVVFP